MLTPVLLMLLMLVIQLAWWWHANQAVTAAADEALDAAQAYTAAASDGKAAATSMLAQTGNVTNVSVDVARSVDTVTVDITADAPQLVPIVKWTVRASATGPVERFVGLDQRP